MLCVHSSAVFGKSRWRKQKDRRLDAYFSEICSKEGITTTGRELHRRYSAIAESKRSATVMAPNSLVITDPYYHQSLSLGLNTAM